MCSLQGPGFKPPNHALVFMETSPSIFEHPHQARLVRSTLKPHHRHTKSVIQAWMVGSQTRVPLGLFQTKGERPILQAPLFSNKPTPSHTAHSLPKTRLLQLHHTTKWYGNTWRRIRFAMLHAQLCTSGALRWGFAAWGNQKGQRAIPQFARITSRLQILEDRTCLDIPLRTYSLSFSKFRRSDGFLVVFGKSRRASGNLVVPCSFCPSRPSPQAPLY